MSWNTELLELTDMVKEVRLSIKGEVVGVGFRAWIKAQALPLAVAGFARNLSEDCVEVVLQSDDEGKLDDLVKIVRSGPTGIRVDSVEVFWREPRAIFGSFEVR